MADYNSGNFINPDYATPEQTAQMRAYAKTLQEGAVNNDAKSWAGVLAHALMGYQGQDKVNQANQLQRQMMQQSTDALNQNQDPNVQALIHGLGASPQTATQQAAPPMPQGPPPQQQGMANPADIGGVPMPPGQNLGGPNTQISGVQYGPVSGNPSFSGSPNSGAGAPIVQALMGRKMAQNAPPPPPAGGLAAILSNSSIPDAVRKQLLEQAAPKAVISPFGEPGVQTTLGGVRGTNVQGPYQTGYQSSVSTTPEGGAAYTGPLGSGKATGGVSGVGGVISQLSQIGREQGNISAANSATRDVNKSAVSNDETTYSQLPMLKQTLHTIVDDINSHGNEISWGPQNQTIQNAKKFAVNFAPGLFTDKQIEGIAAGDSLHKMTGILGTLMARQIGNQGGTDYSQQLGQGQVPGMENSKQGALALANMIDQGFDQNKKLMETWHNVSKQNPSANFAQFKNEFYADPKNQIINPITHNPITQDMNKFTKANQETPGGFRHLSNEELKKLLKLQ